MQKISTEACQKKIKQKENMEEIDIKTWQEMEKNKLI